MIATGTAAPNFEQLDQHGKSVSLIGLRGKPIVLFFFPKTGSKICTVEACKFQSELPDFTELDAAIIGISPDSTQEQKKFSSRYKLTYSLISDLDGKIAASFRIPKILGLITGRVTIVIDSTGVVRATLRNELKASAHVEGAKLALSSLSVIS